MRIQLQNDPTLIVFAKQLLEVGNGKLTVDDITGLITLPNNLCTLLHLTDELIEQVFPNIVQRYRSHDWLKERAILAPKNVQVNEINHISQEILPGETTTYKSVDTVMNEDNIKPPMLCNGTRLTLSN